MTNSAVNLALYPYGQGGREVVLPVDGGAHIYAGTLVSQLTATGMLVPGSTASSTAAVGVALHEVDNTGADAALRCRVMTGKIFLFTNGLTTDACSEATIMGSPVYMGDDHTVFDNSATNTLKPAGRFMGMEPDGKVRVYVGMGNAGELPIADAADIAIADAGTFTAATEVEAALQEIYQDIKSTQATMYVPLASFLDADGDPLAKYSAGNTGVPGFTLQDSEAVCIRWNNYPGNPGVAIITQVGMPYDLDDTADMVLEFLCSKTGATVGDASIITVGAYFVSAGDLHDADANCGGDSDALVGDAIAKTTDLLTRTITAANVPVAPVTLSLTLTPKTGLIETDDLCLHAVRIKYKRKVLTS